MRMLKSALLGAALSVALGGQALAAGAGVGVIDHDWSFEGPFGTFKQDELQRGWQVYSNVCASCHGLSLVSFRDLGAATGPAFPPEQIKAMAAEFPNEVPTLDEDGEPTTRPATPNDKILSPYLNDEQAKAANGGAYPPDLSLITKARTGYHGIFNQILNGGGGPEYIYSLMLGYPEDGPPEGFDEQGLNYNRYFPGHRIAMGQPLWGDDVEYQDGTEATIQQQSHDLVAFLTWAAEPKMVERKEAGLRNILMLVLFTVLLWYSNKKLWKPIKDGDA